MRGKLEISGTAIQHRQEKRAAEKGGPQHGDPQGRSSEAEGTKRKRAAAVAAAFTEHELQRRWRPLHKAGGG
jgi:hypothetical protein